MFIYCNNCPIIQIDISGNYPAYQGEIHKRVQEEICIRALELSNVFIDQEVQVFFSQPVHYSKHEGGAQYGYADLYCPATGEIWEVKPSNWNLGYAKLQLADYINGTLGRYPYESLNSHAGENHSFLSGEFLFQSKNGKTFDVEYSYKEDGIIYYKYSEHKRNQQVQPSAQNSSVLSFILSALIAGMFLFATGGAYAPQF